MGSKFGMKGREVLYNAEISRRIDAARVRLNVRLIDLAKAADVTPQMLRAYQIGVSRWPVFRVRLIADFLAVRVDELMPVTQSYERRAERPQKQLW